MMKFILALTLSFSVATAFADEDHGSHAHEEEKHAHQDEDKHEHGHAEDSHQDESAAAGKGVIAKSEAGFKLSAEAIKTMGLITKNYAGSSMSIPKTALVTIKNEKSVFRVRDEWHHRVPIEILRKTSDGYLISSKDLQAKDLIVIGGTGFLRTAEIFAEEGASHSHSH